MEQPVKSQMLTLIEQLSAPEPRAVEEALLSVLARDCESHFFFPFGSTQSVAAAADTFWRPLVAAFPHYEIRPGVILEGQYEGRRHASMLGFVSGNFLTPFAGVPPTKKLAHLRFGMNLVFQDGCAIGCFVMFDLIDLMDSAGIYPFRAMPGSPGQWLFPPIGREGKNRPDGQKTLAIIREMQAGLPSGPAVVDRASAAAHHSPNWSETMNWFGPAGIGSSRGMAGFRDAHGALFLRAFQDRRGIPRGHGDDIARPGHFCEIGEGAFAMTGGWPNMIGTHAGAQWLGLPPTGREIRMRVADWYRLDRFDRIADNWVMIDIPHILDQMGMDVLAEIPFTTDPTLPRLP
ncbi:hypothetical protein [Erythrobacter sp.]|uniref:hypothetical protein n=1 Tax=Erythrobacter sp. TaxID=1042 RepID=UPI003C710586